MEKSTNEQLIAEYRESGNEWLREDFFIKNKPLCWEVAYKFDNTVVPIEDRVSLAQMGMLKAFNAFDLSKGVKFSSYAYTAMFNEIRLYLRRHKSYTIEVVASLDVTAFGGGDDGKKEISFLDTVVDESATIHVKQVEQTPVTKALMAVLEKELGELELKIMQNLLTDKPLTQAELGRTLGKQRSFISKVGARAGRRAKSIIVKKGFEKEDLVR